MSQLLLADSLINVQCSQVHFDVLVSCDGVGSDVGDSPPSSARENDGTDGELSWYGVVQCGLVWYGMVWYSVVWHGVVWFGMVWYGALVLCAIL